MSQRALVGGAGTYSLHAYVTPTHTRRRESMTASPAENLIFGCIQEQEVHIIDSDEAQLFTLGQ